MIQMNTDLAPQARAWMLTGVGAATPKEGRPARHVPAVDGIRFAVLAGRPVRFNAAEAWQHATDGWRQANVAEVFHEANLLCHWAFERPLPPLPAHAFA